MITEDLIEFIKSQQKKSILEGRIRERLLEVGWEEKDIDEAFIKIEAPQASIPKRIPDAPISSVQPAPSISIKPKSSDPYRELPTKEEPKDITPKLTISSDKPAIAKTIEVPKIETPKTEAPKVWTPASVAPVTPPKIPDVKPLQPITPTQPIIPKIETIKVVAPTPAVVPPIQTKEEIIPVLKPKPTIYVIPETKPEPVSTPATTTNDTVSKAPVIAAVVPQVATAPATPLMPQANSTPKSGLTSGPMMSAASFVPAHEPVSQLPNQEIKTQNPAITVNPKSPILSSYSQGLSSVGKGEEAPIQGKKKKILKWLIITLIILVIGGTAFASINGYINIPFLKNINFSFVKKDPKEVLLDAPATLSALSSYKSETHAQISSPAFQNIISGLMSGEVVPSNDTDTISLSMLGIADQKNLSQPTYDYETIFESSLMKGKIQTDLKYDTSAFYVAVPDLKEIFGENAPPMAHVSVPKNQLNLVVAELPQNISDKINKSDTYKILSNGISPYMITEAGSVLKEFITSASVNEKADEDVHGVSSYHYAINADRESIKKFFSRLVDISGVSLSDTAKSSLDEAIGSISVDSFEIWVGKGDDMLHQYAFTLSIPLSKVFGFEDKGIAGNVVKLEWKTAYSNFNDSNAPSINMPTDNTPITDFVKSIRDVKIKSLMSSFKSTAMNLSNSEGAFGRRNNLGGSCMNPTAGSLFSPVGHSKSSTAPVGAIASTMNMILEATNNVGSCYSTGKAWAMAMPLATDSKSLFCADNTGTKKIITSPLTGTICK